MQATAPLPVMVWATGMPWASGERAHRCCGLRDVHAAAAQHQRPLGLGKQRRCARGIVGGRAAADPGRRRVACVDLELLLAERQRAVADILRHIDHDGTRPAGRGDLEGAGDQLGDAARVLDAQQLLAGGLEDLGLARLLGHVLPGVRAVRVADERDERRPGVERLDEAGDEVGGAGPQGCIDEADAPRHLGVGVGRERAAALVVDEVVIELQAPRRVIEGEQLEAAHAEHGAGAEGLEHAGHRLAARHLVGLGHAISLLSSRPRASAREPGPRGRACGPGSRIFR